MNAAISEAFALSVLEAPPEARVVVDKAETGDGVTVRAGYRCRAWRAAAACVSLLVHAGILVAALAGLAAQVPETAPDPLQVEVIITPGTGGAAGGGDTVAAGASGASAPTSAALPPPPTATPPSTPAASAAVAAPPKPPPVRAATAFRRPTVEARPSAAKRRQQQPAAQPKPKDAAMLATIDTAAPARTEPPTAEVPAAAPAAAAMPEPQPGVSAGADRANGSIGATSSGSVAAISGSGGSGNSGSIGSGEDAGGASRGPGFSLGSAGNPMPPYPPSARRRGIEGTVVLRVSVSAEGRALSVEIVRSSGSDALDEAARDTIARWHFRPAMRAGEAVAATTSVPVQFSLVER